MQTYYSFLQGNENLPVSKVWNELERSINKSYELYIYLHCLLIAVFDFAAERVEINRKKLIPTHENLNPNTKFIDNKIIDTFRSNPVINKYMSNNDYNWQEYSQFINNLWILITNSEYYSKFMASDIISVKEDYNIIENIILKTISQNDELDDFLEEKSIYWNDDVEFMLSNILQSIKKLNDKNIGQFHLLPVFKNEDDENFAKVLIKKTALNKNKFDDIIINTLQKWELERVAFTDRVILHLALCEFTEMPNMPVKVTINEYLEIAKYYSTEKSSIFINGILDKIYVKLREENNFNKSGLGLVDV